MLSGNESELPMDEPELVRKSNPECSINGTLEEGEGNDEQAEQGINLLEALMIAQKEAADFKEGWQRERADYSNYRKRTERQHSEALQDATVHLLRKFLPIIDDLERAIENIPIEFRDAAWYEGVTLIQRNVEKFITENNIEEIDPLGSEFDPNFHEAIGTEEAAEFSSNQVSDTLQKGYQINGRIIRPALVKVAK